MSYGKKRVDTDGELKVVRHRNGIELIKPDEKMFNKLLYQDTGYDVANMLNFPFSVYFMDTESFLQNLNEVTTIECGYHSSGVGESVRSVTKKEIAESIITNDREVLRRKSLKVIEEHFFREKDERVFSVISMKFPWYKDGEVVGVFGLSVPIDLEKNYSLPDSLELIAKTGLLSTSSSTFDHKKILTGINIDNVYITKRESDCLSLLVYGKTAKQIARLLNISYRTVEAHLENMKSKMNVSCKSDLIDKVLPFFFGMNKVL